MPIPYEEKFADFIKHIEQARKANVGHLVVCFPQVLGDTYEEMVESLERIADAGLVVDIVPRKNRPPGMLEDSGLGPENAEHGSHISWSQGGELEALDTVGSGKTRDALGGGAGKSGE